jgi:hypothetical protein
MAKQDPALPCWRWTRKRGCPVTLSLREVCGVLESLRATFSPSRRFALGRRIAAA